MTTTAITEYSQTEAALSLLADKYGGQTYEVATTAGMKAAVAARAELRGYRVALEKKRVEIKSPALERCKLIDSEAKRITVALAALEDPIDAQIKAEEQRKADEKRRAEEAERQRVARIQESISRIRNAPAAVAGKTSRQISDELQRLRGVAVSAGFYQEFHPDATVAMDETIATVSGMLDETQRRETEQERIRQEQAAERARLVAEREELDRLRREQAARDDAERARDKERERAAAVQREADESVRRDEAERQRAAREEADRVRREQEVEAARLEAERRAIERQKTEQAERERVAAEKIAKLRKARRDDPRKALADILAICNDDLYSDEEARRDVALIAEASL